MIFSALAFLMPFRGLLSRAWSYVLVAGAAVAVLVLVFLKGRSSARAEQRLANAKAALDAISKRNDAEIDAAREPNPVERLRRDWQR